MIAAIGIGALSARGPSTPPSTRWATWRGTFHHGGLGGAAELRGDNLGVTIANATPSVRRCRIEKTSTTIALSSFRLHLFQGDPAASSVGRAAFEAGVITHRLMLMQN